MLDDPLYLAGGAAALLALGGLGFLLARRGRGASKAVKSKTPAAGEPAAAGAAAGGIVSPVAPSPETGDFTHGASVAPLSQGQTGDVDPISEAELFLNFGRDAQAEEILKDALTKNPASNAVRLKLLSIYASRKDTNSFSVVARPIEASGDTAAWAQAAEMGRSVDPGNPMYGGGGVTAAPADTEKSEPKTATGLDFDLGLGAPETATGSTAGAAAPDEKAAEVTGLDFDLGAAEQPAAPASDYVSTLVLPAAGGKKSGVDTSEITVVNTSEDLRAAQEAGMDFDVSGNVSPPAAAPEKSSLDDLVFDITATNPVLNVEAAEEQKAASAAGSEDPTIAFALDFPVENKAGPAQQQPAAKEAVDFDLGSISLNLEEPAAQAEQEPPAQTRDARWHDVATKLDLAKAYQEMGDNAGAREILEEVMAEGDEQQRAAAEAIKQQLLA
jgi:pilus assembly protein FimV